MMGNLTDHPNVRVPLIIQRYDEEYVGTSKGTLRRLGGQLTLVIRRATVSGGHQYKKWFIRSYSPVTFRLESPKKVG
jgi:hypothetical protein